MTSSDPEVIRRQIEDTRRELSYDVDALNEKVNPARVVDRRVSAAKGRITNLKEKVMGSAHDTTTSAQGMASNAAGSVQGAASSAAGSVQDAASTAVEAVQQAPDTVIRQTQGNPLAAGLIAFGVGWLVSSLMPASSEVSVHCGMGSRSSVSTNTRSRVQVPDGLGARHGRRLSLRRT